MNKINKLNEYNIKHMKNKIKQNIIKYKYII